MFACLLLVVVFNSSLARFCYPGSLEALVSGCRYILCVLVFLSFVVVAQVNPRTCMMGCDGRGSYRYASCYGYDCVNVFSGFVYTVNRRTGRTA